MTTGSRGRRAGVVLALGSVGALLLALRALSADQPQGPSLAQKQIEYRQALYKVMANNAGPLFAMANDKVPYDAVAFAKRAERVSFIAGILPEAFPAGSNAGAPTAALPAIWEKRADFDQLMQDLGDKAAAVASAAKTKDLKQVQPAVAALGKACKTCHEKFRKEE